MKVVAERSDLQSKLREDSSLIPNFIEEALRLYSTTKATFRMARKPVAIGDGARSLIADRPRNYPLVDQRRQSR